VDDDDGESGSKSVEADSQTDSPSSMPLMSIAKDQRLFPALFLLFSLLVGQQLCGINALFFYSTDFFKLAGLDNPTVGTLLASGVNVIAVMCVLPLLVSTPRRKLLLVGLSGMLVSALILTSALLALDGQHSKVESIELFDMPTEQTTNDNVTDEVVSSFLSSYIPYVALTVVLTFIIFFEVSVGLVPWIVGTEMFPPQSKDAAFSFVSGERERERDYHSNYMITFPKYLIQSMFTIALKRHIHFNLTLILTFLIPPSGI
jgi:hypothetical protein